MAIGTPQQAYITIQAYMGYPDYSHQTAVDYASLSTLTATVVNQVTITVPGSTSYQTVNLATLFPSVASMVFLSVSDVTATAQAFSVSTANSTGNVAILAGGVWAYVANGGTPPTIYLTNSNSGSSSIQISVLSN